MTTAGTVTQIEDALKGRATSPLSDSVGGIIAIVLTILGLIRLAPVPLVAIATIAVGVAVLVQGQSVARYWARALTAQDAPAGGSLGGSWAIGLLSGGAGVILGILALLGLDSVALVAIAAIVLGSAIVFRANFMQSSSPARFADSAGLEAAVELASSSTAIQGMAGLAAVVLGILALAGFSSTVLVLVAFLTLGSGLLINSTSFGGLMLTIFRRI